MDAGYNFKCSSDLTSGATIHRVPLLREVLDAFQHAHIHLASVDSCFIHKYGKCNIRM